MMLLQISHFSDCLFKIAWLRSDCLRSHYFRSDKQNKIIDKLIILFRNWKNMKQ
jgi:hypothetical protein